MRDTLDSVDTKVDALLGRERMQRGFIAGIVFIVSGLWGLFVTFKDSVISGLKIKG
jgi:hypothetical protein